MPPSKNKVTLYTNVLTYSYKYNITRIYIYYTNVRAGKK